MRFNSLRRTVNATLILVYLCANSLFASTVSGVVKSDQGRVIKNAKVTVWDKDPASKDDLLGQTFTNADGRYSVSLTGKRFDGVEGGPKLNSNKPDIYVTVDIKVRGEWERVATSKVHKDHNPNSALRINLTNINRIAAFSRRTIYGVIRDKKGKPVAGVTVKAWDKDWGNKTEWMGTATTNKSGRYHIAYSNRKWDGFAAPNPDVFITVTDAKHKKKLGQSTVVKNHDVNQRLVLNLKVK